MAGQPPTVLVTGGSGFIAGYAILALLDAGYRVHTTVRSLGREAEVRRVLGNPDPDRLRFFAADLTSDQSWDQAVAGCAYVLHVASPFPVGVPKRADELIVPARDGALRVLAAARRAGVARVVLTSSFAAIGYGTPWQGTVYDETHWTNLDDPRLSAYVRSKTLAERAAWDFVARGRGPELAVVNPVAVFGPVLGADYSSSVQIVGRLLDGSLPALPRMGFGVVDVRDVADLHLRALLAPEAAGQRYVCVSGEFQTLAGVAGLLRDRLGPAGARVARLRLPDWVVRLAAPFSPEVAQTVSELGKVKRATNAKALALGWKPRPPEEALLATAESLLRLGLVRGARA